MIINVPHNLAITLQNGEKIQGTFWFADRQAPTGYTKYYIGHEKPEWENPRWCKFTTIETNQPDEDHFSGVFATDNAFDIDDVLAIEYYELDGRPYNDQPKIVKSLDENLPGVKLLTAMEDELVNTTLVKFTMRYIDDDDAITFTFEPGCSYMCAYTMYQDLVECDNPMAWSFIDPYGNWE